MKAVDLFAGCGGLSLGFKMAGFEIPLAIDFCADCAKTYLRNMPDTSYFVSDIHDISIEEVRKALDRQKIDVIIGGPPCQGFSVSGKRVFLDPINSLYTEYLRFVDMLEPEYCLLENVPGLKELYNGQALKSIISQFTLRGYNVSYDILRADDYGIPQSRRRMFIIASKLRPFKFENPRAEKVSLGAAISDLPLLESGAIGTEYLSEPTNDYQRLMREGDPPLMSHVITKHTDRTRKIVSLVPEGGNYRDLPAEFRNTRNVHIAWTRLDSEKACNTIDTGHRHHFHPWANRVLTVRESARVQSFPDRFEFVGSKTSQYRQVGNAVPPLLAFQIATRIKEMNTSEIRDTPTIFF